MPAIIFDLDGTLIDNSELLLQGFRYAYSVHGIDYPGDEKIFSNFGQPLKTFLTEFPEDIRDSFRDSFRSVAHSYKNLKFHDGVEDLLEKLTLPKAIVTGKERPGLELVIKTMDLRRFFDVMISSSDITHPKPSPDGILKALRLLGVESSLQSCYIGDTVIDMRAALNSGITGIGVGWSLSADALEEFAQENKDVYFARDIHQLEELIVQISGRPLSYN